MDTPITCYSKLELAIVTDGMLAGCTDVEISDELARHGFSRTEASVRSRRHGIRRDSDLPTGDERYQAAMIAAGYIKSTFKDDSPGFIPRTMRPDKVSSYCSSSAALCAEM